jgi:hypothetical protein
MKRRYLSLSHENSIMPPFMTIHAFCFEIIRAHAKIANQRYFLIEDESGNIDKYMLISNMYKSVNNNIITEEKLENFFSYVGYIKNMCITPEEFSK